MSADEIAESNAVFEHCLAELVKAIEQLPTDEETSDNAE